ncbi:MAG: hypothetical protein A3F68_05625 [Acidobacteria bacterium RIFCSPLOWO2_12_FULL_54_10]|nr:MAG: hypothetical protein A3F68_05625 [Acidobacteria bacterium RIFCSPLOWO2_12_FULL_54_10]
MRLFRSELRVTLLALLTVALVGLGLFNVLEKHTALQAALQSQGPTAVRTYLQFVGFLYLALGLLVIFRRFQARLSTHFYLFTLSSFVLLAYSYTGAFHAADWAVYWASVGALLLQPALFAHFCLEFPQTGKGLRGKQRQLWMAGIYGTAGLLGAIHVATALGALRFTAITLEDSRWLLDRVGMGYLAAMFILGCVVLLREYRRAGSRMVRKQIAWVLGGTLLAIGPFSAAYAGPYALGLTPSPWMEFSVFSLVILPAAFTYAIGRHHLLDAGILLERSVAYTLATGILAAGFLGVVALLGDFFRVNFPASGTVGLVCAIIAAGLLFQPLQRWIQGRIELYFQKQRYDYREALLTFGRELSGQSELGPMLRGLTEKLRHTLRVQRTAVFLPLETNPRAYVLRDMDGINESFVLRATDHFGFLQALETASHADNTLDRLFLADFDASLEREIPSLKGDLTRWRETMRKLEIHDFFACRTKGRLVAVIGIGKTDEGEFLSKEDAALLETVAGYVAIAVENTNLAESLAEKAKQYEQLQQFSENILESINIGLLAVDLSDRVEAVNTPLQLIYPLPVAEWRGRMLSEVLPADLMEQMNRYRDDAGIHNIHRYRIQGHHNEERVLNIAIAPLLSKNLDFIGRLMVFEDVTDQAALEAQLAQAEKLSSIGLLAAGVAHEVNTPLAVISSNAQMLAKQMPAGGNTAQIVEKIVNQTFRASEIVNSLLNFSRTKGETFGAVDLNKVISDCLLLVEHQFNTTGITVQTLLEPNLAAISGNSGKMQQVFLNLLLNAKDAMPKGGTVRVSTWTQDSVVHAEISDTGMGIAPEHLNKIFDPFFTTKGVGQGTGLGLAVTYGIVQEHAGKIRAESRPGAGTQFRMEFPALRKPVHA